VLDGVEVFQKHIAIGDGQSLPNFLENELVAVCDDSGEKGRVEYRNIVFFLGGGVRWQKARAACSTFVKVACLSKLKCYGMMNFSPLYSIRIDC
jgi:hypothetical protein